MIRNDALNQLLHMHFAFRILAFPDPTDHFKDPTALVRWHDCRMVIRDAVLSNCPDSRVCLFELAE